MALSEAQQKNLIDKFPFEAMLCFEGTPKQNVRVLEIFRGRFRIESIHTTVIPNLHRKLTPGETYLVPIGCIEVPEFE